MSGSGALKQHWASLQGARVHGIHWLELHAVVAQKVKHKSGITSSHLFTSWMTMFQCCHKAFFHIQLTSDQLRRPT
jgi:hypothetical protein